MKSKKLLIEELIEVINRLRDECPWDKEQTIKSLRQMTIEEVYELSDAIIKEDYHNIEEELGDLFLHILFYCKIGKEENKFDINTVTKKLIKKLKERHPHIYANKKIKSSGEVINNWEKIKKSKRKNKATLNNIPSGIPSLVKAIRIQEKVRSVGFDWENKDQVLEKIYEELDEMKTEITKNSSKDKIQSEVGDVLFSIINFARFLNIDPEEALERTNMKFIKRFNNMEVIIHQEKKDLEEMDLEEMDKYWEIAKKNEE